VRKEGVSEGEIVEQIDIGGVTLLRAAAKNFESVLVVCDPADYTSVLDKLQGGAEGVPNVDRKRFALKAFRHTATYDSAISQWLSGSLEEGKNDVRSRPLSLSLLHTRTHTHTPSPDSRRTRRCASLARPPVAARTDGAHCREGRDSPLRREPASAGYTRSWWSTWTRVITSHTTHTPHIRHTTRTTHTGALYRWTGADAPFEQVSGKELSYNNILDLDVAYTIAQEYSEPCVVIIKHNTPCGIATDPTNIITAYQKVSLPQFTSIANFTLNALSQLLFNT
jgi:phosphoribosylaminoimidazolecarboxamide formyltransferase/IMP cyclohydrolase